MQQRYQVIQGDVLATLKNLPADYFDACLSDPPYGISFMGKEWDKGVPSSEVYAELLRVLKPGAFGLHFGGTRMWHRLACNLEEAGFELRDTVMWLYGSGFPKSHNISKAIDKAAGAERTVLGKKVRLGDTKAYDANPSENRLFGCSHDPIGVLTAPATDAAKQWDGWGTALKPAWEPALLVQKPLAGTFANNALTHGCGGLNIEGCRVPGVLAEGRFPANLILDDDAAASLDATVGTLRSGARKSGQPRNASSKSSYVLANETTNDFAASEGGPSRFFYTAKVSTKERNAGLDGKNNHPTLKPLALTEYLARLLLVPARTDGQPRRLLVPFSGAGSEMIGALKAGWDEVWGIELDGDFVRIACARVEHHTGAVQLEAACEEVAA